MRPSLSKSGITPCPASLGWRGRNAADGPTDGAALKTSCAGNRPIIAVSGIGLVIFVLTVTFAAAFTGTVYWNCGGAG